MFDRNIKHKSPMRLRSTCLLVAFCIAIAVLMANDRICADDQARLAEHRLIVGWDDAVIVCGPGTVAGMDSPQAIERMVKRWKARGINGVYPRRSICSNAASCRRNKRPSIDNSSKSGPPNSLCPIPNRVVPCDGDAIQGRLSHGNDCRWTFVLRETRLHWDDNFAGLGAIRRSWAQHGEIADTNHPILGWSKDLTIA